MKRVYNVDPSVLSAPDIVSWAQKYKEEQDKMNDQNIAMSNNTLRALGLIVPGIRSPSGTNTNSVPVQTDLTDSERNNLIMVGINPDLLSNEDIAAIRGNV